MLSQEKLSENWLCKVYCVKESLQESFYHKTVLLFGAVMKRTALTLTLISALLVVLVVGLQSVKASPKTIVVPDDYPTIQAAVDHASAGDRVFVRKGIYNENVIVDKSLSLKGENSEETVIWGQFSESSKVISTIVAVNAAISGFTITGKALGIIAGSGCSIIGNNIKNNLNEGIHVRDGNVLISGNNISGNGEEGNDGVGVSAFGTNVTIRENNISNNFGGINLYMYGPLYVYGNNIADNHGCGIQFDIECNSSIVYQNNMIRNNVGVKLDHDRGTPPINPTLIGRVNMVYRNNFVDNSQQVVVEKSRTAVVSWDNGTVGNYWSDYTSIDNNGDGIGDTAYTIDENNTDYHPLINPITIPESLDEKPTLTNTQPFPTTIVATALVFVAIIGIGGLVYFKKRKH